MSNLDLGPDGSLRISGSVNLSTVPGLRDEVIEELDPSADYIMDLGSLEFEGSAVLLLLVFLVRHLRNGGGSVDFRQVPERLARMIDLAGIEWLLAPQDTENSRPAS